MNESPQNENSHFFQSSTSGKSTLEGVLAEIKRFLEEDPEAEYRLIIGSDSHEKTATDKRRVVNVVTAVVVHRRGFGGRYFWQQKQAQEVHSLREKIYAETLSSLDLARTFVPHLNKTLNGEAPKYNLEIHVDVGEHGDTREMIKEVVGMVTGHGFIAKTKPESFGASYVADKHT